MKKFFRSIHLYLSLATGLVIAIVCFTGAALVFEKELQQSIYPERYTVEPGNAQLPLDQLVSNLQQAIPAAKVTGIKVYPDRTRSVELSYSDKKEEKQKEEKTAAGNQQKTDDKGAGKPEAKGGKKGGKGPSTVAFMNPYTGALISTYEHRNSFFYTMFALHRWLLMDDIGKMIVGVSTLLFLFILLTGIILWWPKKMQMLKQRLTLKWNAGWKRINHDLHIVIGFYTALFLFVFAFTGLAWSFEWFNNGIYWVTGTENKKPEAPKAESAGTAAQLSYQAALQRAVAHQPKAQYYTISKPKEEGEAFTVTIMATDAAHEKASDQIYLHPQTGAIMGTNHYADRNLGQRMRATFYAVHIGSVGGWPARIVAFLSCLAGVTFPVTGVVMWLQRLRKKKNKKNKAPRIPKAA